MSGCRLLAALAVSGAMAGCSVSSVPLPGGAPDGPAYRIVAEFGDVLDLVPQSAVKVNDVTVGSVERIWLSRTERSAEVEEVLAALGMLLNGGGLAQLKTINEELSTALAGRETEAKDALRQLDAFIGGLDMQRAGI